MGRPRFKRTAYPRPPLPTMFPLQAWGPRRHLGTLGSGRKHNKGFDGARQRLLSCPGRRWGRQSRPTSTGTGVARRRVSQGKARAAVPTSRLPVPVPGASLAAVAMEEPEMQLKGKKVTDKFTESVYVLANEPSVALYRLQEHVRRSLPELAQHKADMQRWEEQSQGAIYTVEYACSAVKNLVDSSVYFRSVEGLLRQAISIRDHMNASAAQGHSPEELPPPSSA